MEIRKKTLSIIAPMYNEVQLVDEFCLQIIDATNELRDKYSIELIFVDDGSDDETLTQMRIARNKYPNIISVLKLSRNFGLDGAISAGLSVATGDAVIVMDADLQDPPRLILKMVNEWEAGAKVVIACRAKRSGDGFFKKITADFFYRVLHALSSKFSIQRGAANYRLLDREAVNLILSLPEANPIFRISVPYVGLKTKVIYYDRVKRLAGKTKYSFRSLYRYALDNLTGLSIEPLRGLSFFAFFSMLITAALAVGIFMVPNSYFQMLVILAFISFFFSLLFLCISIMSEYLGQIFLGVKNRPSYLISEYTPRGSVTNGEFLNGL